MKLHLARSLALAALALAAACEAPDPSAADEKAPFPYTPAQIRAANPAGTEVLFRVEALGSPTVLRRMTFVAADESGATIESRTSGLHGEPIGGVDAKHARWEELRDHASFPADRATRTEAKCEVEAGTYECWKYVIDEGADQEGLPIVTRFWFAHSKPGPPVLMETERDGVVVLRMELVEERRP